VTHVSLAETIALIDGGAPRQHGSGEDPADRRVLRWEATSDRGRRTRFPRRGIRRSRICSRASKAGAAPACRWIPP